MIKKKEAAKSPLLIYIGVFLAIVWIIVMVAINNTYLRSNLLLIMAPIALGMTLLGIGASRDIKNKFYRIALIAVTAVILTYFSYWMMAILFVGRYGIGG